MRVYMYVYSDCGAAAQRVQNDGMYVCMYAVYALCVCVNVCDVMCACMNA